MLHRQVLFRSSLVRIADVSCRARRGCGTEEEAGGCQVIFVRSGVFVKRRGTQRRVAEPNTALLLNAAEPYRIEHPLDDGDECTSLTFSRETVAEAVAPHDGRASDRTAPFSIDSAVLAAPTLMARQLLRGRLHADAADVLAAEERALALLDRVIADAYRQPVAEAAPHRPRTRIARRELVEAAKLVLTTRPGEAHSLASLARAVHASPFHLARVFRAETGQPIHRYLLQLRLALALERLADGAGSLVDLAFELGFTSHSHFTEAFRRRFGLPPSVCRRRLSRRLVGEMRKNPTA